MTTWLLLLLLCALASTFEVFEQRFRAGRPQLDLRPTRSEVCFCALRVWDSYDPGIVVPTLELEYVSLRLHRARPVSRGCRSSGARCVSRGSAARACACMRAGVVIAYARMRSVYSVLRSIQSISMGCQTWAFGSV